MARYGSWGRHREPAHAEARRLFWRSDALPAADRPLLAYGYGRSYGDVCLNDGGCVLDASGLDRVIAFDRERGVFRCEGGMRFDDVLAIIVPAGWFLPVSPGTKFVSVAGAIANDVHGKNHHVAGTFGRHVTRFELLRSDGTRTVCAPDERADLFRATIGGLGLTGLITWAEFRLLKIGGPMLDVEHVKYGSVEDFLALSRESDRSHAYSVAWVDAAATGERWERGVFMRANHADDPGDPSVRPTAFSVPVDAPEWLLNRAAIRLHNEVRYRFLYGEGTKKVHYEPFFYPLDGVGKWNRLYGGDGFFQYQFVVPTGAAAEGLRAVMRVLQSNNVVPTLAVLKMFGDLPSPGMLSFPRPGATLALDVRNDGARTLAALEACDRVVRACGGRAYPAKDARMSAESFRAFFPQASAFSRFVDPAFSSDFWKRVSV